MCANLIYSILKRFVMKKIFTFVFTFFTILSHEIALTNNITNVSVMDACSQENVEFIHIYFTALSGNLYDIIIPIKKLESALMHGLKYDGSSIPGCSNIFESDMHLALDINSFFINPHIKNQPKTARIFADVYQDETVPYPADSRYLLKQAIELAALSNYEFFVGPELEFFFVEKNNDGEIIPWDSGYYCGIESQQKHETIKFEIMQILLDHGINLEKLHHEVAPGQHELVIQYNDPLTIADHIMLTKHLIKQIAGNYGIIATFMPKPFFGMNGTGMHIHFSLTEKTTGLNLFFDEQDDALLSSIAYNFITGILSRIEDGALVFNSTINSYKRLVPGYEAPVYICWAKKNRSALMRIPQINKNQPYAARAEIRCGDALCNPYLAFTLLLQSGLAGIANNEQIIPATEENLFKLTLEEIQARNIITLPSSLQQAINNFTNSTIMPNIFSSTLIKELLKLKHAEVLQFQKAVTDWEIKRYL